MNRSRKKRSRGEARRHKRLREENERIASRQDEEYAEDEIPLRLLLKKYKVELLLVGLVIIGVAIIMSLGPDKKTAKKLRDSFNPFLYSQSWEWDEAFSQGYKIIVLTDKNIIQTSFDTLPDDLKINWKKMSVARVQSSRLNSMTEKIKITLTGITYAPADMLGVTATVILSRQKGASARLAQFGKIEFVAKIVEDDGEQLFCLFGLRDL